MRTSAPLRRARRVWSRSRPAHVLGGRRESSPRTRCRRSPCPSRRPCSRGSRGPRGSRPAPPRRGRPPGCRPPRGSGRSRRRTAAPPAARAIGTPKRSSSPGSQARVGRSSSRVRDALPASMASSPVSCQTSQASTVPTAMSAGSAPAAAAASRACRILGAENMGSRDRPVRARTSAAAPGWRCASSAHQASVRASCHPSTGPSGRPLDRCQQTTDSRWFEIDTPDERQLRSAGQALLGRSERGAPQLVRVLLDHAVSGKADVDGTRRCRHHRTAEGIDEHRLGVGRALVESQDHPVGQLAHLSDPAGPGPPTRSRVS